MTRQAKISVLVLSIVIVIGGLITLGLWQGFHIGAEQIVPPSFRTIKADNVWPVQATILNQTPSAMPIPIIADQKGLIQFDLSEITGGQTNAADISRADLLVYVGNAQNQSASLANTLNLYLVNQDISSETNAVTDVGAQAVATTNLAPEITNGWLTFSLTGALRDQISAQKTVMSFLIQTSADQPTLSFELGHDSTNLPMIQYTLSPVANNVQPTATAVATTPVNNSEATIGHHGEAVKNVNQELAASGLISEKKANSDYFGLSTYFALKNAKKNLGLPEDGKIDANTQAALAGQPYTIDVPKVAYKSIFPPFSDQVTNNFFLQTFMPGLVSASGYGAPVIAITTEWVQKL